MTNDQRTRSAERSGDRVAWLTERMRRGDRAPWDCSHCHHGRGGYWREGEGYPLNPDGSVPWRECPDCQGTGRAPFRSAVELAAYAGDPAARAVLGPIGSGVAGVTNMSEASLDYFVSGPTCPQCDGWGARGDICSRCNGRTYGLSRWPGALERAALAACEVWQRHDAYQPGSAGTVNRKWAALQAARAHIEAPSEATREALGQHRPEPGATHIWPTQWLCVYLSTGAADTTWGAVINQCARLSDPAAVRAGICAALIAWSLG